MKVTIILQAKHIPDGTTVRKVTGENTYLFRTSGVPVYTYGGELAAAAGNGRILEGCIVLQSSADISVCAPGHHLAIDFDTAGEAVAFLEENDDEEEGEDK